ncbi:hypothetical protein ESA_00621 [Cronobacter sakazakii ATCC BAA-894]|uniref:Uncharacterized protein n=1 Tax=Cronobacter sakazakii (strain ATCC BAA-894) TaxID=290339 RepID=A7MHY0_CROS8|nr:hypothetical protein ESA_00621 [Cronobacter sakazakii ATCC BAA-894]
MAGLRGKHSGLTGFNDFAELVGQQGDDRGQRRTVGHAAGRAQAVNRIKHVEDGHANRMGVQQAQVISMRNGAGRLAVMAFS